MRAFLLALVAVAGLPGAASAQDAFEIQVYDAETAAPGEIGLETHLNSVLTGRRSTTLSGEAPTHRVFHATLEPHFGVTDIFTSSFRYKVDEIRSCHCAFVLGAS